MTPLGYQLWVNATRTVLVRLWDSGKLEVAVRESADQTWGPPVECRKERT